MKGGGQRPPVLKGATTPPEETRVNAPTVDRAKLHPAARMADTVRGADIIAAIKAGGVKTVVALPDIVTVSSVLKPLANDSDIRLVRVCKEDEGIGICAGLSYCDQRAVLLMQSTGLLDSLNAVRAVAVDYALPIVMVVGLIGKEVERAPSESVNYGVRIVEPVLDAMEVRHVLVETHEHVALIVPEIERAYAQSEAVVILIGRPPRGDA